MMGDNDDFDGGVFVMDDGVRQEYVRYDTHLTIRSAAPQHQIGNDAMSVSEGLGASDYRKSKFEEAVAQLHKTNLYEILPYSSKCVVLDTMLPMRLAFYALLENDIRAAPLWSSTNSRYEGLFTVTDFIDFLIHVHDSNAVNLEGFEEEPIIRWKELAGTSHRPMVSVPLKTTLYDALVMFKQASVHRLSVVDEDAVVTVVSRSRIIQFLANFLEQSSNALPISVEDLRIGSFSNIATVTTETPLIEVLRLFANRQYSTVPVVNEQGVLVDVYSKLDVVDIARNNFQCSLTMPLSEVLKYRRRPKNAERVQTCTPRDPLGVVIRRMALQPDGGATAQVAVDSNMRVIGIITIGDVLRVFIE